MSGGGRTARAFNRSVSIVRLDWAGWFALVEGEKLMVNLNRLKQYISKASFSHEADRLAALQCLENAIPDDNEILQVASDESQQEWNDLRFKNVYVEAFTAGAKWMRNKIG